MHQTSTKLQKCISIQIEKTFTFYPTRFSNVNYIKPTYKLNKCSFQISIREPPLWNEFLTHTENEIESTSSVKIVVKHTIII